VNSWLSSLPHQIPFRAAAAARKIDDETVEGAFFCSSSDALARAFDPPASLVVEAMAQIAGSLVFTEPGAHGYLSAIDDFTIDRPLRQGDRLELRVRLDASFGGIWRFSGAAFIDGTECARARFYLAAPK
jgi:hypothetical protein